jgi:molybdate transport system substrate-binding protein
MSRLSGVAVLTVALALLNACATASGGTSSQPVTLNVFAAASLQAAFTKIGQQFHAAHSNVTVTFSFGGSNMLAQQIVQGAPADVFASANAAQMNVVVKGDYADAGSVKTFAHNRLIVVLPKNNPANIQTLQDLAKPGVKVVLAASAVPAGQYALVYLAQASTDPTFGAGYKANVLKNVVSYEQDVKSVLTKVSLGEADAGIVYVTDAQSAGSSVATLPIPDALNNIALYPIVAVKHAVHAAAAQQFVDYVTSASGQAVLANYGFIAGSQGTPYVPPTGT